MNHFSNMYEVIFNMNKQTITYSRTSAEQTNDYFTVIFRTLLRGSEIRCAVQKFISQFSSKAFNWLRSVQGLITAFTNRLVNSEMNF